MPFSSRSRQERTLRYSKEGVGNTTEEELIAYIRDHCGHTGSHSDEHCLYCGMCPITEILKNEPIKDEGEQCHHCPDEQTCSLSPDDPGCDPEHGYEMGAYENAKLQCSNCARNGELGCWKYDKVRERCINYKPAISPNEWHDKVDNRLQRLEDRFKLKTVIWDKLDQRTVILERRMAIMRRIHDRTIIAQNLDGEWEGKPVPTCRICGTITHWISGYGWCTEDNEPITPDGICKKCIGKAGGPSLEVRVATLEHQEAFTYKMVKLLHSQLEGQGGPEHGSASEDTPVPTVTSQERKPEQTSHRDSRPICICGTPMKSMPKGEEEEGWWYCPNTKCNSPAPTQQAAPGYWACYDCTKGIEMPNGEWNRCPDGRCGITGGNDDYRPKQQPSPCICKDAPWPHEHTFRMIPFDGEWCIVRYPYKVPLGDGPIPIPWEHQAAPPAPILRDEQLIKEITLAVRGADRDFEKSGGSSRHWVREQFIPHLQGEGLTIIRASDLPAPAPATYGPRCTVCGVELDAAGKHQCGHAPAQPPERPLEPAPVVEGENATVLGWEPPAPAPAPPGCWECAQCGHHNWHAKYCTACGAVQPAPAQPQIRDCRTCGHGVGLSKEECVECHTIGPQHMSGWVSAPAQPTQPRFRVQGVGTGTDNILWGTPEMWVPNVGWQPIETATPAPAQPSQPASEQPHQHYYHATLGTGPAICDCGKWRPDHQNESGPGEPASERHRVVCPKCGKECLFNEKEKQFYCICGWWNGGKGPELCNFPVPVPGGIKPCDLPKGHKESHHARIDNTFGCPICDDPTIIKKMCITHRELFPTEIKTEETIIIEAIKHSRAVQDYLWGWANKEWGIEEWRRMLRKRVEKLDELDPSNPHYNVELRKRVLQTAALSVALLAEMEKRNIKDGVHPSVPSNLPQYSDSKVCTICGHKLGEHLGYGECEMTGCTCKKFTPPEEVK